MKSFFNKAIRYFQSDPNEIGSGGYTRLQAAIAGNDIKKVKALVKSGADLNLRGSLIFPPLHYALDKDRRDIALILLEAGADINLQDAEGKTPLYHASVQGQEGFIRALLKMGALPDIADHAGLAPLHVLSTSLPGVIEVFARHKARLDIQDNEGNTPLHLHLGKTQMAEGLLLAGASPNVRNRSGVSAYMMVLEDEQNARRQKIMQLMLDRDADLRSTNQLGETILHLAARLEMRDAFNKAVDRCELSVRDAAGNNVLHALVRRQNLSMISKVLDRVPELLQQKNTAGLTPLGELAGRATRPLGMTDGLLAAARLMILRGADPSAQDQDGCTLLHHAVTQDRGDFVRFLMLDGKINPDLLNNGGKAALHIAINKAQESGNLDMLDLLLDLGADPDLTDDRGWTVLDRQAGKGDRDSPVVQRLIVAGGQYQKQLPLNPELMRKRKSGERKEIDKSPLARKPSFGKDEGKRP